MDLLIFSGTDFKRTNNNGDTAIQLLMKTATVSEIQEQLKAKISLHSFKQAFQEYLNPSHARQSQEPKSRGSSKKSGCILM